MTRAVILSSKRVEETIVVSFPFQDVLQFGETINNQVVTCTVFSGIDPAPAGVILGAATLSGTTVLQQVTAGLPGVIYQLVAAASGSGDHVYTKGAKLAVINDAGLFTGLPP